MIDTKYRQFGSIIEKEGDNINTQQEDFEKNDEDISPMYNAKVLIITYNNKLLTMCCINIRL